MSNKLNEHLLPDNYQVYADYLYVCDGKVIRSDVFGTVATLKKDLRCFFGLKAKEIFSCDIKGRKMLKQNE